MSVLTIDDDDDDNDECQERQQEDEQGSQVPSDRMCRASEQAKGRRQGREAGGLQEGGIRDR
jgi:hypothetical protein